MKAQKHYHTLATFVNLSTEHGKELKKQRSIQAEGAFGVIKQDMEFIRFTRRRLEKNGIFSNMFGL